MYRKIGNHDLRLDDEPLGGYVHVALTDADDGDVVIINEDDLVPLRDELSKIIARHNLGGPGGPGSN